MHKLFTRIASTMAALAGQPLVFLLTLVLVVGWAVSGPLFRWSDAWQLVINTTSSLVTLLMVFIIQNSQNRDNAAMQAKLDELIHAQERAREQLIGIEHLTDVEIGHIRASIEREASGCEGNDEASGDSAGRVRDHLRGGATPPLPSSPADRPRASRPRSGRRS